MSPKLIELLRYIQECENTPPRQATVIPTRLGTLEDVRQAINDGYAQLRGTTKHGFGIYGLTDKGTLALGRAREPENRLPDSAAPISEKAGPMKSAREILSEEWLRLSKLHSTPRHKACISPLDEDVVLAAMESYATQAAQPQEHIAGSGRDAGEK